MKEANSTGAPQKGPNVDSNSLFACSIRLRADGGKGPNPRAERKGIAGAEDAKTMREHSDNSEEMK